MKALTLTQPWATLVACGAKRIETRSWTTSYRGPLAIHAAKGWRGEHRTACVIEPFYTELRRALGPDANTIHDLPRGAIIATVDLVDVLLIGSDGDLLIGYNVPPLEEAFGDFTSGRYAWMLANAQLVDPVQCRGALGLWNVPAKAAG